MTPDPTAAARFYATLLGWEVQDTSAEYGGYVIAQRKGAAAAGIGPLQQSDTPAAWTLYFASDDVDATAHAITAAGGSIVLPAGDVGPLGRMLLAADPSGAVFGVWQAGQHIGAGIVNEPGALTWVDLRSQDPDRARVFYTAVFGHGHATIPNAPPDYQTFALPGDEAPLGGMGGMMGAPEGTPSHWLVYFGVADAEASAAVVDKEGGRVLVPPFLTDYGPMAPALDPQGAAFWLAQPTTPQPDRAG